MFIMKNGFILLIIIFSMAAAVSCTPPVNYRKGWMFSDSDRDRIVRTAKRYIGVKYKHGGTTPGGFDCSGYTKYVYKKAGLTIPRTTQKQYNQGKRVRLRDAGPGDLVFFNTSGRGISHVGVYVGNFRFLHAPRTGKKISYASLKNRYWKRKYKGAVSYLVRGDMYSRN